MENAITMLLSHLGVNKEAAVAQLGDFLREQFNAVHGVTENNRLIDIQLQTNKKRKRPRR